MLLRTRLLPRVVCNHTELSLLFGKPPNAHGINVKSAYSARKGLVDKGSVPRPRYSRFKKAQVVNDSRSLDNQSQIQLPSGALVGFKFPVASFRHYR